MQQNTWFLWIYHVLPTLKGAFYKNFYAYSSVPKKHIQLRSHETAAWPVYESKWVLFKKVFCYLKVLPCPCAHTTFYLMCKGHQNDHNLNIHTFQGLRKQGCQGTLIF